MTPRRRAAALVLLILVSLLSSSLLPPVSPARAETFEYNHTQTMTRKHTNADGTEVTADTRTVTAQVSQVAQLKARQQIEVKWSGAHPSLGVVDNQNAADASLQEYPVMIMQCRGDDASGTLKPSTCWTQGIDQRKDTYNIPYMFPPWRLDRDAAPNDVKQIVGFPDPLPANCPGPVDQVAHYEPFVAADKTVYRPLTSYDRSDVCGPVLAPDMVNVEDPAAPPTNTTFASTDKDGNGSARFVVWTGQENASLGCSATEVCSLVILPIMGMSCDSTFKNLPAGDRPAPGRPTTDAETACRAGGQHEVNDFMTSPVSRFQVDTAVTAADWWSPSIWKNRFSVKLGFGTSANICDIGDTRVPVDLYGSEMLAEATTQWAPAFCSDPTRFKFRHVQMGEPQAKSQLGDGSINAALVSRPPDSGDYGRPVVNAPIAVSGFAISYMIDDKNHNEYADLKLNPRLIAKLLSESYPSRPDLRDAYGRSTGEYKAMAGNPLYISLDPEFRALNPDVGDSLFEALSSSALLALSGNSDVMWALSAYLNADPEARAFLNGEADPWGMVVNPGYKGIELPREFWPLLDDFIDPSVTPYSTCGLPAEQIQQFPPQPFGPLVAAPVTTMMQVVDRVQFGQSNVRMRCSISLDTGGAPAALNLTAYGRQRRGDRFVMGITSLAQAQYYQLRTAALQTTSTVDKKAKFTDVSGRTFTGPTDESLKTAMQLAKPDAVANAWVMPYDALRSSAGAYPGTLPVYAAVATKDITGDDPARLAQLLRYAVADGQVQGAANGQLPPGYLPLTAANGFGELTAYTLKAADAVAAQKGDVPRVVPVADNPQPTATGTTPSSNGGGGGTAAVPDTGSRPSGAPSASASASPAPAAPVAKPTGTTALLSSVLASWGLPLVLLVGLCAGCAGSILRMVTGFNEWRRSLR
ncbi:hypothetical protein [Dactylosporangium sp. CA-233914]|uniref:hypothetical protein n=1 Tax=Dactylosporangium sp. CA-233914 TaxID=3239934 RepID=UPI003D9047AE